MSHATMTITLQEECIQIIKSLVGNEYLYFDSKVSIKTTPHTPSFSAWAVCVSPSDALFIMDEDEQWHEVELNDRKHATIIGSLYQRLRLMKMQYSKQGGRHA